MLAVGEGPVQVQLDLAGSRVLAGLALAQQGLVAARACRRWTEADQPPPDTRPVLEGHAARSSCFSSAGGGQLAQGGLASPQWPPPRPRGPAGGGVHFQGLILASSLRSSTS